MPSKNLQPALWGGLFIGVLSALPIVSIGNLCCCMWVIGGGVITAYLMQQASPVALTVGDGAVGGLMAGVIGAVVDLVLSIPVRLLTGPMMEQMLRRWLDTSPEFRDAMPGLVRPGAAGAGIALAAIAGFVMMLVIGVVFGTIGGMLGAAIFNRGKPTVVPPPPPPPAM